MSTTNKLQHLISIDMLRGVAAFAVLLFHLLQIPDPDLNVPDWLRGYLMKGGTGVILFFVISSFTLCLSWDFRSRQDRSPEVSFFVRRFFRVAPLFYFMLMVFILRDFLLYGKLYSGLELITNLSFLYNLVPGSHESIVWAGWTLGIEMIFYFIFPFLQWSRKSFYMTTAFFLGTSLVACLWRIGTVDAGYGYMGFLNHLPVFAFGFVVYNLYTKFYIQLRRYRYLLIFIWLVIFLTNVDAYFPSLVLTQWQALYMGVGVLGVLGISFIPKIFVELGKVSYSFYLIHPLIIWTLRPLYKKIEEVRMPSLFSFAICCIITVLLVYLVSLVTYNFIEKPSVAYGKKVVSSLNAVGSWREWYRKYLLR